MHPGGCAIGQYQSVITANHAGWNRSVPIAQAGEYVTLSAPGH